MQTDTIQRTFPGATPGPENLSKAHHVVLGLAFQRRNVVAKSVLPNLRRKDNRSCSFNQLSGLRRLCLHADRPSAQNYRLS